MDEALAGVGGRLAVLHGDGAAGSGLLARALAGDQVVPGIVGNVIGALGGVDAEQVYRSALVAERDADFVAVDGAGPVGDPVRIDFAAEDADRRRVLRVRRGPDGAFCQGRCGGREEGGGGGADRSDQGPWGKECGKAHDGGCIELSKVYLDGVVN